MCMTPGGLVLSSYDIMDPYADVFARTQVMDYNEWPQLHRTYCERMRDEMLQVAPTQYVEDNQTCIAEPTYAR